ncbi:MAG: hypothetical protein AAB459_02685 [Patescibacteria group bacterium]
MTNSDQIQNYQPIAMQCPRLELLFAKTGVIDPTGTIAACPENCMLPGGVELPRHRWSLLNLLGTTRLVCLEYFDDNALQER